MKRLASRLARFMWLGIAAGASCGAGFALANLISQDYLAQGLYRLAARIAGRSIWTYAAVGFGGSLAAWLVDWAAGFVLRESQRWMSAARRLLAAWIAAALLLAWSIWHDFGMYPRDRAMLYLTVGVVLAIVTLATLRLTNAITFREWIDQRAKALPVVGGAALALALSAAAAEFAFGGAGAMGPKRPNVLLIVMDTVRADRLSCYGYERPTTPELDALAREGVRYPHFYATSSWTVPSHASLFTGLYAARHRATQEFARLRNEFATLAEVLSDAGYQTWGASGNPAAGWVTNMMQGFDAFHETFRQAVRWYYGRDGHHPANAAFGEFLRGSRRDQPFFAFINYIEAHNPYLPPDPFFERFRDPSVSAGESRRIGRKDWTDHYLKQPFTPREFEVQSRLYDGEVAYVSSLVGEVLEALRDDGRYDDTLIMVTSDHGELFGEGGRIQHVFSLSNKLVRVPLIVRRPGGEAAGTVDDRAGQLVDLFPTILNACGARQPGGASQAENLFAPPAASSAEAHRAIVAEYYFPLQVIRSDPRLQAGADKLKPFLRRLRSYQEGGYRFIWASDGKCEFYDVTTDPDETKNLFDLKAPSELIKRYAVRLERAMQKHAAGIAFDPMPSVQGVGGGFEHADPEARRVLKELGYVQDD